MKSPEKLSELLEVVEQLIRENGDLCIHKINDDGLVAKDPGVDIEVMEVMLANINDKECKKIKSVIII
jgi:hypothetical protein